jgi:hypothetical protein
LIQDLFGWREHDWYSSRRYRTGQGASAAANDLGRMITVEAKDSEVHGEGVRRAQTWGERRIPLKWIALSPLVLVAACMAVANGPTTIVSYQLADERTLILNLETNPTIWFGVTGVEDRPDAVVLSTREIDLVGLPGFGLTRQATIQLSEPLGTRLVIDAGTGLPVRPRQ